LRKEVKAEFSSLEDLLILPLLGLSHADYLEFKKIAGNVRFIKVEESTFDVRGMKQDPDRNDAEFIHSFCTSSIIEIQDRVADIV
ncbi:MAG: hypothetical protein PVH60_05255, partial [Anaerolineales bacterium]